MNKKKLIISFVQSISLRGDARESVHLSRIFEKKSFLFRGAKEKEYYHSIVLFKRKLLRPVPIAGVNGKCVVIAFSRDTHEKLAVEFVQKNKLFWKMNNNFDDENFIFHNFNIFFFQTESKNMW